MKFLLSCVNAALKSEPTMQCHVGPYFVSNFRCIAQALDTDEWDSKRRWEKEGNSAANANSNDSTDSVSNTDDSAEAWWLGKAHASINPTKCSPNTNGDCAETGLLPLSDQN